MIESIYVVIAGMIIFFILIGIMIYFVFKKKAFKKAASIFVISIILLLITFTAAAKIDEINSKKMLEQIETNLNEKIKNLPEVDTESSSTTSDK